MRLKTNSTYLVGCIMLLALGIRLIHLSQSFWLDEAAQALESARPLTEQFELSGDFQPPLFHLLVYLFEKVGRSEWWLRLASVIPGIITLWFAVKIAQKQYGDKTALLTAILGALSAFHFFYSQELRPYSLAAMFAVFSMYYFIQLIHPLESIDKYKLKRISIGYILSSALALYTMYLTGFLLLTQFLIVIYLFRDKIKLIINHQSIIIFLFLPWMPKLWEQLQNGLGLAADYAGWSMAVSLPWFKSLPLTFVRFLIGMILVDPTLPYVIGGLIGLMIITFITFKAIQKRTDWIFALWLIIPTLIAFLVSFSVPVLEPKRLLFCLPALWILVAAGLVKLRVSKSVLTIIMCVYALPLVFHLVSPSLLREDWRTAVAEIETSATPQSVVLFAFPGPFAPFTWYQTGRVPAISTGIFTLKDESYLDANTPAVLTYDRVYVFEYLMDLSDPQRLIFAWLKRNGFEGTKVIDYRGVGFVYIFDRLPTIALR